MKALKRVLLGILSVVCVGATTIGLSGCDFIPAKEGKSAYEIWLENGHSGTEEDFLEWLKGENGDHTHEWGEGILLKEATLDEDGVIIYLCACGEAKYEALIKLSSKGLEYALNEDGKSYSVTSVGACTDTDIIIPAKHEGKPVTSIGNSAFLECTSLTNVVIPNSVTSIGFEAFSFCSSLTSVEIPDSVTSIAYSAFSWCNNLTSVVIGDGVTSVGDEVFYTCGSLTSVVIGDSVTSIGCYAFADCGSLTSVVIGNSVRSIGPSAFFNCDSLTSVEIPDSVTSIGDRAFSDCENLTSVEIPDSVTSIGDGAFYACGSLTSVVIGDSATRIGGGAFSDCYSLTSITVSEDNENYQSIDGNLYSKDGKTLIQYAIGKTATSFTIPDSVTSIDNLAFSNCFSLTSIVIPDGVTSFGYRAFYYCYGLTSIVIPDCVTSIGDDLFSGCSSLTSVVVGDSVTSIGNSAFSWCESLTSVYYRGTAGEWEKMSIYFDNDYLTGATRYYYSESQPTEAGNYWYYNEDGNVTVW